MKQMGRIRRRTLATLALAFMPAGTRLAHGATDDSWINAAGGTWDNGANWSLGVAPVSTSYNGVVSLVPANPYTVNIVNSFTNASITLGSSNATIAQTGGTVTTSTVNLNAGTYTLNGGTLGTLKNATVNLNGGTLNVLNGTVNGVTVAGADLTIPSAAALYIQNGLAVPGKNLNVNTNDTIYFDGDQTENNININAVAGYAVIRLGSPATSNTASTLTLGNSASLNGPFEVFNYVNQGTYSLINNGTINSSTNGFAMLLEATMTTNSGYLKATNGGTLECDSTTFTNTGTIVVGAGSKLSIFSNNLTQSGTLITATNSQTSIKSGTTSFTGGTVTNAGSLTITGPSTLKQSGAGVTVGGSLMVAPTSTDTAVLSVSSGTLAAQAGAMIGSTGSGTFTQTSGTTSVTGVLSAGNAGTLTSGSGTGIINISGGSLYADTVLLGATAAAGGTGQMTVSGSASVTIGGGLHLNDLTVNGGTVSVLNQAPPAGEDAELNKAIVGGYLSNGALNLNGGVVNSPLLKLGITSGMTGTFTQTGGSGSFSTLSVGNDGTLTSGSGIGVANISGGTLYADTVLLGATATAGGTGALTVSGTAGLTIGGGLHLNDLTVNGGSVTVLDQTPPAGEDPELNRAIVGGYLSNGALLVNGGLTTTPYIKLGVTSGFTGTYAQTAGTVGTGTLCVGNDLTTASGSGVGSTTISGGTLSIGTLLVGSTAGGNGSVNFSGTAAVRITKALTLVANHSSLGLSGGTLTLDAAPAALASDAVPVGDGTHATRLYLHNTALTGSGASLTVAAKATLDGGGGDLANESVGSVNLAGTSLTMSGSSSVLHLAVGGSNAPANAGVTFDQITEGNGTFTVGGATLQLLPLSGVVLNVKYPVIVTTTGGVLNYSQVFSNLTFDPTYASGTSSYFVTYAPAEIDVTFTAVPEPATTAVIASLVGLTLRRRKKARKRLTVGQ